MILLLLDSLYCRGERSEVLSMGGEVRSMENNDNNNAIDKSILVYST
jgi:hypothetical protein